MSRPREGGEIVVPVTATIHQPREMTTRSGRPIKTEGYVTYKFGEPVENSKTNGDIVSNWGNLIEEGPNQDLSQINNKSEWQNGEEIVNEQ